MKRIYFVFSLFILFFAVYACQTNTYSQGKDAYVRLCANCHGDNGEGLQGLIPPLAGSDYLKNNKDRLACIINNGLNGEIVVNGKTYNQAMPALTYKLTAADITNICNYTLSSWGNNYGELQLKQVEQQLEGCKR
jgi:mono/diheme cytochrome c family protein